MVRHLERFERISRGRHLTKDALSGMQIAVGGGTNGIGRALAPALVAKGADVLVTGRTFRDHHLPGLHFLQVDLSSLKSARTVAQQLPAATLDLLVLTQGIFAGRQRQTNVEGIELDMAVSHLSRFVMVHAVAERFGTNRGVDRPKPRVFIMGFPGQEQRATVDDFNSERTYSWNAAHLNTVVGNEALVLDCAERYPSVNFYGLNPGIMKSNIMSGVLGEGTVALKLQQTIIGLLFQSVEQYAEKILPLLVSPDIEAYSGSMFGRHSDPIRSNAALSDKSYLMKVTHESEKLAQQGLD